MTKGTINRASVQRHIHSLIHENGLEPERAMKEAWQVARRKAAKERLKMKREQEEKEEEETKEDGTVTRPEKRKRGKSSKGTGN